MCVCVCVRACVRACVFVRGGSLSQAEIPTKVGIVQGTPAAAAAASAQTTNGEKKEDENGEQPMEVDANRGTVGLFGVVALLDGSFVIPVLSYRL